MPFDALSKAYERFRPGYPERALREFVRYCDVPESSDATILDVGSGTGISTRVLRSAFGARACIVAVEPSAGMIAESRLAISMNERTTIVCASAEALPCEAMSIDVVFAAQAVQWFDRDRFFSEADRVLRGNGVIGIAQNNRDWANSRFLEEYEELLERYSPGYDRHYRAFNVREALQRLAWATDVRVVSDRWSYLLKSDEFLGLALSSTKMDAAVAVHGLESMSERVLDLTSRYAVDGRIELPYSCELFMARKS